MLTVVVRVTQNDNCRITVLDADRQQHKIRLGGIDAPEKAQPFGQRSKENLSRLVFGKDVRVEWEKRDKYKRIVGKVWVQPASCPTCPMTLDAGHAQITAGMAWWYRKYAKEQSPQDRGRLRVLGAGSAGRGVSDYGAILIRCHLGNGGEDNPCADATPCQPPPPN